MTILKTFDEVVARMREKVVAGADVDISLGTRRLKPQPGDEYVRREHTGRISVTVTPK